MTDTERIEFLESLLQRRAFQNKQRPSEFLKSDIHFNETSCSIYLRDIVGTAVWSGYGTTFRQAVDHLISRMSYEI